MNLLLLVRSPREVSWCHQREVLEAQTAMPRCLNNIAINFLTPRSLMVYSERTLRLSLIVGSTRVCAFAFVRARARARYCAMT